MVLQNNSYQFSFFRCLDTSWFHSKNSGSSIFLQFKIYRTVSWFYFFSSYLAVLPSYNLKHFFDLLHFFSNSLFSYLLVLYDFYFFSLNVWFTNPIVVPNCSYFWFFCRWKNTLYFHKLNFLRIFWRRGFINCLRLKKIWFDCSSGFNLFSYSKRYGSSLPFIYLYHSRRNMRIMFRSQHRFFSFSVGHLGFRKSRRHGYFAYFALINYFVSHFRKFTPCCKLNIIFGHSFRRYRFLLKREFKKLKIRFFYIFYQKSTAFSGTKLGKRSRKKYKKHCYSFF